MPATTDTQRTLMCIAWEIKKGNTPASYSKQAAKMAEQMSMQQLKDFCESPAKK